MFLRADARFADLDVLMGPMYGPQQVMQGYYDLCPRLTNGQSIAGHTQREPNRL